MTLRTRTLVLILLFGGLLTACSSNADTSNGATSTPTTSSATKSPIPISGSRVPGTPSGTPAGTPAAAAVAVIPATPFGGQTVSDGICRATIPDDWVDNGAGSGTTPSGARYTLFGGLLTTQDGWKEAVQLVKDRAGSQDGAKVSEGNDFVRVDFKGNRGFEYRTRVNDRYCDFTVANTAIPIPETERASWDAIIASLALASQ